MKGCSNSPAGTDRTANYGEHLGYSRASYRPRDNGKLKRACQGPAAGLRYHALASSCFGNCLVFQGKERKKDSEKTAVTCYKP